MQIVDRCASCKIAISAESLVLHGLKFQNIDVCPKFPGGAGKSGLNLAFSLSLLNME
jgi:hypothetical protein